MRFLIAGSSGFLGTRLRERLGVLGHDVTQLVRRAPGPGQVRWDPYTAPLGADVVDNHDVVVNLAGTPTIGNPHSKKWAHNLMQSRVATTRVLAEAIAESSSRPVFLAGNAVAIYGDHGDERVTEETHPRSDTLLAGVTRAWQAAAQPARHASGRVCVMRTSPVYDRRSQPLGALRLQFKAGLGGRLGNGRQYVPMISTRDWVDAVIHLAETDSVSGPVNLCCRADTDECRADPRARPSGAPTGIRARACSGDQARRRTDGPRATRVGQRGAAGPAGERLRVPRPRCRGRAAGRALT